MMRDPVTAPTGITYDRDIVEGWLERGHSTCPVTGLPLRAEDLIPNHATRRMIQDWCVANRALGVERVPTPRVPLSAAETGSKQRKRPMVVRQKARPRAATPDAGTTVSTATTPAATVHAQARDEKDSKA